MRNMTILVFLGLLLGGCVAMDISTMNTAEPLGKNHTRLGVNAGMGASMTSVTEWDEMVNEQEDDEVILPGALISGFEGALGVTDHSDLGAKAWIGGSSAGFKLLYKNTFAQTSPNVYTAVIPAFAYSYSEGNGDFVNGDVEDYEDYHTVGGEFQLLITKKFSQYTSMTLAGQTGAYLYNGWDDGYQDHLSSLIYRVGMGANLKLDLKPLYLMLEAGGEMMLSDIGGTSFLPYAMVGIGLN